MRVPDEMIPAVFMEAWAQEVQTLIDKSDATGERTTCWEQVQVMLVEHGVAQRDVQIQCDHMG